MSKKRRGKFGSKAVLEDDNLKLFHLAFPDDMFDTFVLVRDCFYGGVAGYIRYLIHRDMEENREKYEEWNRKNGVKDFSKIFDDMEIPVPVAPKFQSEAIQEEQTLDRTDRRQERESRLDIIEEEDEMPRQISRPANNPHKIMPAAQPQPTDQRMEILRQMEEKQEISAKEPERQKPIIQNEPVPANTAEPPAHMDPISDEPSDFVIEEPLDAVKPDTDGLDEIEVDFGNFETEEIPERLDAVYEPANAQIQKDQKQEKQHPVQQRENNENPAPQQMKTRRDRENNLNKHRIAFDGPSNEQRSPQRYTPKGQADDSKKSDN